MHDVSTVFLRMLLISCNRNALSVTKNPRCKTPGIFYIKATKHDNKKWRNLLTLIRATQGFLRLFLKCMKYDHLEGEHKKII